MLMLNPALGGAMPGLTLQLQSWALGGAPTQSQKIVFPMCGLRALSFRRCSGTQIPIFRAVVLR